MTMNTGQFLHRLSEDLRKRICGSTKNVENTMVESYEQRGKVVYLCLVSERDSWYFWET